MNQTLVIEPPYSLLMLEDVRGGTPPESLERSMFAATRSCLLVACQAAVAGQTTVELITEVGDAKPLLHARYETWLESPSLVLALRSAELATYTTIPVDAPETHVSIHSDSYENPSYIQIVLQ